MKKLKKTVSRSPKIKGAFNKKGILKKTGFQKDRNLRAGGGRQENNV